jgi:hypothetical protein
VNNKSCRIVRTAGIVNSEKRVSTSGLSDLNCGAIAW